MKKKKKVSSYILLAFVILTVLFMVFAPMLMQSAMEIRDQSSVLSYTAAQGSIASTLAGAGTLIEQDAFEVTVPVGVSVTEYLVQNGDIVKEGDPLARVKRSTVMSTIAQVQEDLETIAKEMQSVSSLKADAALTAAQAGRVMAVYAQEGDDVQRIIKEHGALALLSLDGMLTVQIESSSTLHVGDAVQVVKEDESIITGRVKTALTDAYTITVSDADARLGETVSIVHQSGAILGSGTLSVSSPWRLMGFTGTVSDIPVQEGQLVAAGKKLMVLQDTEYTAEFAMLAAKHRTYEDTMTELFTLYGEGLVYAPSDGCVSGLDEGVLQTAAGKNGMQIMLLANNTPNGNDEGSYENYAAKIGAIRYGELMILRAAQPSIIDDYASPPAVDDALLQEAHTLSPAMTTPVYEFVGGAWQSVGLSALTAGDKIICSYDSEGALVWMIRTEKAAAAPGGNPDGSMGGNMSGSMGGFNGSFGNFYGNSGLDAGTESEELLDLTGVELMLVTPQEEVRITITVDELDVFDLAVGQSAAITLDALPGQLFSGTVTKIDTTSSNAGGNSKYTAEIVLARTDKMLGGMNASAVITIAAKENVLLVPVAALSEEGRNTFVYCAYDEGRETFGEKTQVTVGVSDGEMVEIISGLSEGDTCYYTYYGDPNAQMQSGSFL